MVSRSTLQREEPAGRTAKGTDPRDEIRELGIRVTGLRDEVRARGQYLGEDLLRDFDQWIAEGEELHQKAEWRLSVLALSDAGEMQPDEIPVGGFYFG